MEHPGLQLFPVNQEFLFLWRGKVMNPPNNIIFKIYWKMIRNSKTDKGATRPWLEALSESILHKVSHKEGGEILNWPARLFQFGATFTWEPILNWVIYLGNSGHWFIEQSLKRTITCKVSLSWTKTAFWKMLKKTAEMVSRGILDCLWSFESHFLY